MNPAYGALPELAIVPPRPPGTRPARSVGREIFGYTDGDPDAKQEINVAHWHGYAKHPDYPDVIVVCGITDSNEQVYRNLDWPDKFKPNWANGWYYHIEFEGKYKTMGSGTSWGGDLSEERQGKRPGPTPTTSSTAPQKYVLAKRTKDAEKAAKRKGDRRPEGRVPRRQAGQGRSRRRWRHGQRQEEGQAGRRCRLARLTLRSTEPGAETQRGSRRSPGGAGGSRKQPPSARRKRKKSIPPTWSVLPPMSPVIVDPTPVVIDALVANMINRPTFLPPETDFEAIAAAKIAEHYGFDTAKTTEAARQLAALLKNPDVTSMTPGLRNNTLRTHPRNLLH